jgi:putative flippase GtrA
MMIRRLTTFGLVGLIGTGAHYLALVLLVEMAGMYPVTATSVGFVIGALVNYVLNHRYTFRSSKAHLDAGPKFFLIAIATGILNSLLVYAGVSLMGANYLLVQIGATLMVFLANFALNSLWTFQEAHAR